MKLCVFKYECRRCGKMVETVVCKEEDGEKVLNNLMSGLKSEKVLYQIPGYYNLHICNDKKIGICDLLGYDIEEDKGGI